MYLGMDRVQVRVKNRVMIRVRIEFFGKYYLQLQVLHNNLWCHRCINKQLSTYPVRTAGLQRKSLWKISKIVIMGFYYNDEIQRAKSTPFEFVEQLEMKLDGLLHQRNRFGDNKKNMDCEDLQNCLPHWTPQK